MFPRQRIPSGCIHSVFPTLRPSKNTRFAHTPRSQALGHPRSSVRTRLVHTAVRARFSTHKITSQDLGISDLLYFTPEDPPKAAPQPLPLDVSVALVAPQQSLNVGAVARLMSLFGHQDLYISPNDGGIDAMRSGYVLFDVFDDVSDQQTPVTVCLTLAPLLSPFAGYEPNAQHDVLIKELTLAFDASVAAMKKKLPTASSPHMLVRPLMDLPPLIRLAQLRADKFVAQPPPLASSASMGAGTDTGLCQRSEPQQEVEPLIDLHTLLLPHVPQLLGFLDSRCFHLFAEEAYVAGEAALPGACVFTPADVRVSFADRKGTRLYGPLKDMCKIYSHVVISLRADKLWAIAQATRAAHEETFSPQPCPLAPDTFVSFNLTVMRAGKVSFKGAMSAQWNPDEATQHLQEWAQAFTDENVGPSPFEEFLAATEHACSASHTGTDVGTRPVCGPTAAPAEDASAFQPARLHPGCAISTTAFYMATKRGVRVLQRARLFEQLEDLLPHFDLVVGTSALFKPIKGSTRLPDSDDASSPVLRPWELADVLVRSVADHERLFALYNAHAPASSQAITPAHATTPASAVVNDQADASAASGNALGLRAPPLRVLLVMGREVSGLTSEELALCDHLVTIPGPSPIGGTLFSLNLSHACGILLYELSRLRQLLTRHMQHQRNGTPLLPQSPTSYPLPGYGARGTGLVAPPASPAYPCEQADVEAMVRTLRQAVADAATAVGEAEAVLAAGHSVEEAEPAAMSRTQLEDAVRALRLRVAAMSAETLELQGQVQTKTQELASARLHARLLENALISCAPAATAPVDAMNDIFEQVLAHDPDFSHLPSPHQRAKLWRVFAAWLRHFDPYTLTQHSPSAQALRERVARECSAQVSQVDARMTDEQHVDDVLTHVTGASSPLSVRSKHGPQVKGDFPKPTHSSYLVDFGLVLRKLLLRPDLDRYDMGALLKMFAAAEKQLRIYRDALGLHEPTVDKKPGK